MIPARNAIKPFSFRVSTVALRELQPRLAQAVMVPDHLTLQPTLIERFIAVFKMHVEQNPVYYIEEVFLILNFFISISTEFYLKQRIHISYSSIIPLVTKK